MIVSPCGSTCDVQTGTDIFLLLSNGGGAGCGVRACADIDGARPSHPSPPFPHPSLLQAYASLELVVVPQVRSFCVVIVAVVDAPVLSISALGLVCVAPAVPVIRHPSSVIRRASTRLRRRRV